MRVLFPLVTLLAGAQALSNSLNQKRGGGLDVCAYVDVGVEFNNPLTGKPMSFGHIGGSILVGPCLRSLNQAPSVLFHIRCVRVSFGDSYPRQEPPHSSRGLFGRRYSKGHELRYRSGESASIPRTSDAPARSVLATTMTNILDVLSYPQVTSKGSNCDCPDHGTLVCSKNNPCDFTCSDGYTPYGGKCVCKPPYKECSGKCGLYPNCPSKSPHKRDTDEWKKHVTCDRGYTACGVLGRSKLTKESYECVDARNDLESCEFGLFFIAYAVVADWLCDLGGGCSIPLHRGSPMGVDCTSLPGVADVSCMNGSCYVQKCAPGYQLAADNSMCLDDETIEKFTTIGEFGWEQFVPIGIY